MTTGVAGMTTENVANIMKTLGCTDAINLDGGGSSCMLVNGQETIKTSDSSGDERSFVPQRGIVSIGKGNERDKYLKDIVSFSFFI